MTKRNGLLIVLAILVIAALAACGGGNKADTTPQPKLAEPIETVATRAAQPTEAASPTPLNRRKRRPPSPPRRQHLRRRPFRWIRAQPDWTG